MDTLLTTDVAVTVPANHFSVVEAMETWPFLYSLVCLFTWLLFGARSTLYMVLCVINSNCKPWCGVPNTTCSPDIICHSLSKIGGIIDLQYGNY